MTLTFASKVEPYLSPVIPADEGGVLCYEDGMTTNYLTDERGEKVAVVIPIADYEELMENVTDLACVAERRDEARISLAELKEQLVADGLLAH